MAPEFLVDWAAVVIVIVTGIACLRMAWGWFQQTLYKHY